MLRQSEIEEGEARRTNATMGLIVILVLAILGVLLVRSLREKSQIEKLPDAGPAQLRADRDPDSASPN